MYVLPRNFNNFLLIDYIFFCNVHVNCIGFLEYTRSFSRAKHQLDLNIIGLARALCNTSHVLCAVQVYPGAWTAILISLDNVGIWNLRTENLDSWYRGQETYIRVVNPEATNKTELPMPDNTLFCGALQKMQKYVSILPCDYCVSFPPKFECISLTFIFFIGLKT